MKNRLSHLAFSLAAALATLASAGPARADLTADLGGLEARAGALRSALEGVSGPAASMCGGLVTVTQMSRDLAGEASRIDGNLAAPLTVDGSALDALERLSLISVDLAREAGGLSVDLSGQKSAAQALNLKDGITAVLQLSSDIGTMADRIGEMSNKILVMSDDVGAMADRILLTQQIQSQNLQTTEATLLQTQVNALTLVSVVEDATYGLSFEGLAQQGKTLGAKLSSVLLNPLNMAQKLGSAATDVRALRDQIDALRTSLVAGTSKNTVSTSATALSQLLDLTVMLNSLGAVLNGYTIAVSGLQAITSTPTLTTSLKSMLQLSADIGLMANRILEMADQILAMADNIGLEADQIILTQEAASANVATTQASILAAQQVAITLIAQRTR
jgi:hypothetical protein